MLSKEELDKLNSLPDVLTDSEEERDALLWLIARLKDSQAEILHMSDLVLDLINKISDIHDKYSALASFALDIKKKANSRLALDVVNKQVEIIEED